jgi:hypothetical protein
MRKLRCVCDLRLVYSYYVVGILGNDEDVNIQGVKDSLFGFILRNREKYSTIITIIA